MDLIDSRELHLFKSIEVDVNLHDQYANILKETDDEPSFYGIPLNPSTPRIIVVEGGAIKGFFEAMASEFNGRRYYRANRPYVPYVMRGKGVMRRALEIWFAERRPAMAWIDDNNISSIRLYQGIGFVKDQPLVHKECDGHVYFLP